MLHAQVARLVVPLEHEATFRAVAILKNGFLSAAARNCALSKSEYHMHTIKKLDNQQTENRDTLSALCLS